MGANRISAPQALTRHEISRQTSRPLPSSAKFRFSVRAPHPTPIHGSTRLDSTQNDQDDQDAQDDDIDNRAFRQLDPPRTTTAQYGYLPERRARPRH